MGDLSGGSFYSVAYGVSANASVIVGKSESASGAEAFYWTPSGGMQGIGDLPGGGFHSAAKAVSADGSVVVGYGNSASGREAAFRWTVLGGMQGLGDLPGGELRSVAEDVSGDGSVVVGYGSSASGTEAFIWDAANGMQNLKDVLVNDYSLDLTGWTLIYARGISDDGLTIVGYGINPDGYTEGWVATVPEPATICLLGLGSLAMLRRRKSA